MSEVYLAILRRDMAVFPALYGEQIRYESGEDEDCREGVHLLLLCSALLCCVFVRVRVCILSLSVVCCVVSCRSRRCVSVSVGSQLPNYIAESPTLHATSLALAGLLQTLLALFGMYRWNTTLCRWGVECRMIPGGCWYVWMDCCSPFFLLVGGVCVRDGWVLGEGP